MSRSSWVIIILITILLVSSYFFSRNREAPDWVKCKESLFEQVVFKSVLQVLSTDQTLITLRLKIKNFQVEGPEN